MKNYLKVIKAFINALMTIILILGIAFIFLFLIGIEPSVVESGSMEPSIHVGSLCFVNKHYKYEKIKENDIIAFKIPTGNKATHRVIRITEEGFETKGDANEAAELIDNMTVAAATLSAGSPASIIRWEKVGNRYELELGIPVPTFTTSTTTTYDGTTAASVTVNNSNSLTRNLAFSIPVAKFTVN